MIKLSFEISSKIQMIKEAGFKPKYIILSDNVFKDLALSNKNTNIFVVGPATVLLFNVQVITSQELAEDSVIGV